MPSFHKYFAVSNFDKAWGIFVTSVGHNLTRPNASYPTHQHPPAYQFPSSQGRILDQFLLLLIGSGRGTLETHANKVIELKSGDMIFLPPGTLHRYQPDLKTGWEEYWVCFGGSLPEQWQRQKLFRKSVPILGRNMETAVRQRFDELMAAARLGNYSPQLLASLTQALFSEALFNDARAISSVIEMEAIRRAADSIRKHPEDFNLNDVAAGAGMMPRSFQRAFTTKFGISPAKFAQEERISYAKRWLAETDLPLRTIAERLKFSSEFYFMRAFKRGTGQSPGSWRADLRRSARFLASEKQR